MAVSTVTRKDLRRLLAGPSYLDGLFTGVAEDDGEVTLQAQDTLVDASSDGIKDAAYDGERWEHPYLYLPGTGEEHRVLNYDAGTGSLQIGRSFSATPTSGATEYEVHSHGVSVADLHTHLNWALRSALHEEWVTLPGLLVDGDMDDSGVSHWTPSGSATRSKATEDDGTKALLVTPGADYVASDAIDVYESRSYRVGFRVRAVSGTAALVVRDETNGADVALRWQNLQNAPAADGRAWVHLAASFVAPAGCAQIKVRLGGGTAYWQDGYLYDTVARELRLPDWLTDPLQQVVRVAHRERAGAGSRDRWLSPVVCEEPQGRYLPVCPGECAGPIVLHCARPFAAMTSDADTLPAWAQDWIVAGAFKQAYRQLIRPKSVTAKSYTESFESASRQWFQGQIAHNPVNRHGHAPWLLSGRV